MKLVEFNITAKEAKRKYGSLLGWAKFWGNAECAVIEINGLKKLVSMKYIENLDLIFQ